MGVWSRIKKIVRRKPKPKPTPSPPPSSGPSGPVLPPSVAKERGITSPGAVDIDRGGSRGGSRGGTYIPRHTPGMDVRVGGGTTAPKEGDADFVGPVRQPTQTGKLQAGETKKPTRIEQVKEVAFGRTGEQLVGVGVPGSMKPLVTFRNIGDFARKKGGIPGATFDVLLPKTPGSIAMIGGFAAGFGALPTMARVGVQTGIVGFEGRKVFKKDLPKEERIASGIIATGAATGLAFEAKPIKPPKLKTTTEFKARTKPITEKVSEVEVIGKTKIGEETVMTISKERIGELEQGFVGGGKGFVTRKLAKGKTEITELQLVGGGKQLGESSMVRRKGEVKFSIESGTGIQARGFAKQISKGTERKGLRFGIPEFEKIRFKKTKFEMQEVFGTIKPRGEDTFFFAGQTTKPTKVLTREGFSKVRLREVDIKGTIKQEPTKDIFGSGQTFGGGQTLSKPKTISKPIQESIAKQVAGQISGGKQIVQRDVIRTLQLTKPKTKPIIKTSNRKITQLPQTKTKLEQLPTSIQPQIEITKPKTTNIFKSTTKTRSRTTPTTRIITTPTTKQPPILKQPIPPKIVPKLKTPTTLTPRVPRVPTNFVPPIIPFKFPGGPSSAKGGRRMSSKKMRGQLPSFGAIYFRQFGKTKAPTFKGKYFSGFEQRKIDPKKFKFVLQSKRKKKKKKK